MLLLDPENMAQFIESGGIDTMIKICDIKFKQRADTLQVGARVGPVSPPGVSPPALILSFFLFLDHYVTGVTLFRWHLQDFNLCEQRNTLVLVERRIWPGRPR